MKALIEWAFQRKGAMAEWHRARADVAGGCDVSVFSVHPACQAAWWLQTKTGGQCRCSEDPHRSRRGCGKTVRIFHTKTHSVCCSGHGSQDVMHTAGPVFKCLHVFLYRLWVSRESYGRWQETGPGLLVWWVSTWMFLRGNKIPSGVLRLAFSWAHHHNTRIPGVAYTSWHWQRGSGWLWTGCHFLFYARQKKTTRRWGQ